VCALFYRFGASDAVTRAAPSLASVVKEGDTCHTIGDATTDRCPRDGDSKSGGNDGGDQVTREEVLTKLGASRPELDGFHVTSLSVFGSVARDEASADSDVDVLVEFDPEAVVGLFEFVRLQRYLTQLLGRQVDLATPDALHKALRASILSEVIRAA
jgi:hypothetical protein